MLRTLRRDRFLNHIGGIGNRIVKTIHVSGVGTQQVNYILPVQVHRGTRLGTVTTTDIYLNNNCKVDFSDVSFYDANGVQLSAYLAVYGNYELVPDSKLGQANWIHSNGSILASRTPGLTSGVQRSDDNGATWVTVKNTLANNVVFVDSRGYAYIIETNGYKLYRSTNWTGASPTCVAVLDMTAVSGFCMLGSLTEDAAGNLYFGRYQSAFDPVIYKSTNAQAGGTWAECFGANTSPAWQANHAYSVGDIVRPTTPR